MVAYVPDPPERMSAAAFLDRYVGSGERVELIGGEVVAMAAEQVGHNLLKAAAFRALSDAARRQRPDCQALADGMAVRVDDGAVFEPDAALRCGPPLDLRAIAYDDPVVVVEVSSPSTAARDLVAKLPGYFALPSLAHYLILDPAKRQAVHFARTETPTLATGLLSGGVLLLDPPGIDLDLDALFAVLDGPP